ncbi:amidohydrolase [Photobacterium nomapromontoriensis]|uniref:amidohydrolase n=1 Tax=Photobacterium nomapromontoriensis TaxID=2910237 RepID=UPI003D0A7CF8
MKFQTISMRLIDTRVPVTLFEAKKVITMNPEQPEAETVAVQNGIIVGVGSNEQLRQVLRAHRVEVETNSTFANHYMYAGFAEHHMHPHILGAYLKDSHYLGYVDRKAADGSILKGTQSVEQLKSRLAELIEQDRERLSSSSEQWLNCWGFDPLLLSGADVTRNVLDEVSTEFPICLGHASGHVININSVAIELCGYENMAEDPNLFRYDNGQVNGTVAEPPLMQFAFEKGAAKMDFSPEGILEAGEIATKVARINGCTSVTDKGTNFPLTPGNVAAQGWITGQQQGRLHTRVIMEPWYTGIDRWVYGDKTGWDAIHAVREERNPYLTIGNFKMLTDGSIQGFTANLLPDQHYITEGKPNGHLLMTEENLIKQIQTGEEHGMSCSIHTNGNGATELAIQAIEKIREQNPNCGFRHSLEHCQLATENQFYRMKKAGITPNLFTNHLYYWGDVHAKYTVGEHGVRRMDACRSATNHGLMHGVHSDDMVTEVSPLFSAWCAVNRKSLSGKVYGEDQCLTVAEAMRVITYNHAWLAHQEDVRGSIETGKWADFTILEEEATEEKRETLKDIRIVGTVIGGDDIFLN